MLLLGIDTATPATTVAAFDGGQALAERVVVDARRHAEVLVPAIAATLDAAGVQARDLSAIAVGVGPGPYTGLRVGVATAVALGDALGCPVHGICSLDVLAAQAGLGDPLTVVTDARRREVFWASYDAAGGRIAGPAVGRPGDVAATVTGRVVGPGALMYAAAFGDVSGPDRPSAAVLCALVAQRLASGETLLPALPVYLRRPDATVPGAPKPVLPV